MLSLYGSLKVPDVERVTLFRDDERPHKFYMITDKPSIMVASDGTPLLDFISYARNPDVVMANLTEGEPITDLERGFMQVTVGLQVSESDQVKIRAFLKAMLQDEASRHARYLDVPVTITDPELSYPPFFVDGSASVNTFNEDLQYAASSTISPAKSGVCAASFSYDLTQEGAALMLQSLRSDSLPVVARYEGMKFAARIPALKITITGERSEIFKEMHQKLSPFPVHWKPGIILHPKIYFRPKTMGEFRETFHSLTITIDDSDFRDSAASDDISKTLENMALDIVENTILPSFFEPMLEVESDDDSNKKSSWWLRDEQTRFSGSINMTFSKRDVVLMEHNANGQIGKELTENQKEEAVRVLDLSQTEHEFMKMVIFPNINFETDPVFAFQVFVDYDEFDEIENKRIKTHQEAVFQKGTLPIRKVFKLARAADGMPKMAYKYSSVLTYTSASTVPSVAFPPLGGTIESTAKNLILTYPAMGHVKAMITLGTMPESVLAASVTVKYQDESIVGSEKTFELDRTTPSAVYLLNTNKVDAEKQYSVSVVYRMVDGSTLPKAAKIYTGESVVIASPFEDTLETVFAATGDFVNDITSISVTARYEDAQNGYRDSFFHTLTTSGELARWNVRLVDQDATDFTYDVTVFNKDGSITETKDLLGILGNLMPVGRNARSSFSVIVDGGAVDWSRFSHVFVQLEYVSPVSGEVKRHNIRMVEAFGFEEWTVLIDRPDAITYRRRATFIGKQADDRVDTGFEESTEPFFLPTVPA